MTVLLKLRSVSFPLRKLFFYERHSVCFIGRGKSQSYRRTGHVLVAAIDIGTNYSGCACQLKSHKANKSQDRQPSLWIENDHILHEKKTASSILLNPDKSFNSFG